MRRYPFERIRLCLTDTKGNKIFASLLLLNLVNLFLSLVETYRWTDAISRIAYIVCVFLKKKYVNCNGGTGRRGLYRMCIEKYQSSVDGVSVWKVKKKMHTKT